jgi:hypothetical protein
MLSTTYKKAAQLAKKSSKAALSLILVFFAFLGFNAMPTDSEITNIETIQSATSTPSAEASSPASNGDQGLLPASNQVQAAPAKAAKENLPVANAKARNFSFTGLDKNGIPSGFTITDSNGALGSLYMNNRPATLSDTELVLSQIAKTDTGAANIFLSQLLVTDTEGFNYTPTLSYGRGGSWVPLVTKLTYLDIERMIDGNYLMTAIIRVESEIETLSSIPAYASGRDLLTAPRQVITRLVLNQGKTQVLAQAIQVIEKGVK